MKPKISIDSVCISTHLILTREERSHLEPQMIKIVGRVKKLEELELDLSKGEVYSAVSFSIPFREDEIRPSFPNEPVFLIGEKEDPIAICLSDMLIAPATSLEFLQFLSLLA